MDRFRVIAVVDIKGGRAVHAVKGQRDTYAPVHCSWCTNGSLQDLLEGYSRLFGLHDVYVADLDAILGGAVDPVTHRGLIDWRARHGARLMVDAGVSTVERFDELASLGHDAIILGTESIASQALLADLATRKGIQVIVSIDVKNGQVITPVDEWHRVSPPDLVERLAVHEPAAFISLNLSRVGSKEGVDPVAVAAAGNTRIPVLLGGGIRSVADIAAARDAGLGGVLVATALLDGSIAPGELAPFVKGW